jgi:hypothetical protein
MSKVSSYGKVWALGHQQAIDVLDGPVVIQEKVDGSQFSFANINGDLLCRSKGQQIGEGGNCEGMFRKAVLTAGLIMDTGTLPEGMVVRGECLEKQKHNTISYSRVPIGNIAIWDISTQDGSEIYLQPEDVREYGTMWGMEVVPTYFAGSITGPELRALSKDLLQRQSFLGGAKIEGIVIKNYKKCDSFGKMMAAKIVADGFKEQNSENWKAQSHGSAIDQIIASFQCEAIWRKAIQHAAEEGVLLNEPKDIGYLVGAIKRDFHDEHGEAIKKKIFREFYSDIERGIMKGFPEWYKAQLAERVLGAVEPDERPAN